MKRLLLWSLCCQFAASFAVAESPREILLWPDGAPGSEGKTGPETINVLPNGERQVTTIHRPTITPFLPVKGPESGAAVLVIPGGGHRFLCVDHEGYNLAQWLSEHGVAAFVLKHRMAREAGSTYTIMDHAVPDAERALRLIRARASEWNIDPARVGALGFSAGGELVAQAAMRAQAGQPDAADPLDRLSSRPAFQALIYPGRSGDVQPVKEAPPAFLACSANDRQDISEGLPEAYLRFKRAGVPAELHVYSTGGHGFGYRTGMQPPLSGWADRFLEWMASRGLLKATGSTAAAK